MSPRMVSREEWLAARNALLAREKAVTRELDEVRAERRQLPWVKVEKCYVFEGPDGRRTLDDLFENRSQLAIYHFMLAPDADHVCPNCCFLADHVDCARQHFENADLSFAAISRARVEEIEAVKRRMDWRFAWVSSSGTDFNTDFGVSFRPEEVAAEATGYNYGTTHYPSEDLHGASVFAKDSTGQVFHTYSTYARGIELLAGAFNWLDLTPKGRNEVGGIMSWVRLHDRYEAPVAGSHDCCAT